MKKIIMISLIVAASLLLVGGLIFLVLSLNADSIFSVTLTERTQDIPEGITSIEVDTEVYDIEVVRASDKPFLKVNENSRRPVMIYTSGTSLVIEEMEDESIAGFFARAFSRIKDCRITLYIPDTEFDLFDISTETGNIAIEDSFKAKKTELESETGNITLTGASTGALDISTETGNILIDSVTALAAEIETDTGNISLIDSSAESLNAESDTGNLSISNSSVQKSTDISTATGNVTLNVFSSAGITVETDTGDVSGRLSCEMIFYARSTTGKVSVPKSTSGGLCDIRSATGDITFEAPLLNQ
ncbi:MAG: DUF4097 domain-containing protein [Ruminococcaceae bacterium]|nr:DUF4097 domain-containing protein [Oscillospiraceae bacterium]